MAHDHRDGVLRAGERHLRPLLLTFGLIAGVMAVEIVGGILTNSLALLSDAGHMGTDAVGLGMALAAIIAASRVGASSRHTFGLYRVEILAALVNALLLFGIAAYVLAEGIRRFQDPPSILAGPMLAVAALGLAANVIGWRLLRDGASESLNVEGAFMEVVADLVGSVGVIAAAVISLTTGW
ncbi:MAG: cation transporter, partial [Dehalococcoidia bacterium]|nr:cation transporter [Dehalococcoidia bacterium]